MNSEKKLTFIFGYVAHVFDIESRPAKMIFFKYTEIVVISRTYRGLRERFRYAESNVPFTFY